MNALTGAGVEAASRLFSTLDPTIRRLKLPGGMNVMLSDTVGFIHRLPHQLVEAFKATLEEVRTADLLLHVVDGSSPTHSEQIAVVEGVLEEIGAQNMPRIMVFNKADLADSPLYRLQTENALRMSALKGEGIEQLVSMMAGFFAKLREEVSVTLPAARGDLIAAARRDGQVLDEEYLNGRVHRARAGYPPDGGAVAQGVGPKPSELTGVIAPAQFRRPAGQAHRGAAAAASSPAEPAQFPDPVPDRIDSVLCGDA